MKRQALVLLALALATAVLLSVAQQPSLPLDRIKLAPGFSIDVYATGVKNARAMALSPAQA